MTDGSLSTSQVAPILGISAERVGQLARSGTLASTPTELGRLFDPAVVRAFAADRIRYLTGNDAPGTPAGSARHSLT